MFRQREIWPSSSAIGPPKQVAPVASHRWNTRPWSRTTKYLAPTGRTICKGPNVEHSSRTPFNVESLKGSGRQHGFPQTDQQHLITKGDARCRRKDRKAHQQENDRR